MTFIAPLHIHMIINVNQLHSWTHNCYFDLFFIKQALYLQATMAGSLCSFAHCSPPRIRMLCTHLFPTILNPDVFVWISYDFWQNGGHLSRLQMFLGSGLQIPFKIGTICNPTSFDHFKSRLVQISDSHCWQSLVKKIFGNFTSLPYISFFTSTSVKVTRFFQGKI